jgi:hypothetical protein
MLLQTSRIRQSSLQRKRLQLSQCMAVAVAPKPDIMEHSAAGILHKLTSTCSPCGFRIPYTCWRPRGPNEKPRTVQTHKRFSLQVNKLTLHYKALAFLTGLGQLLCFSSVL